MWFGVRPKPLFLARNRSWPEQKIDWESWIKVRFVIDRVN